MIFRYKDRFLASLPASRRASADFTRPVFTAVAFYLCAKRHKVIEHFSVLCSDWIMWVVFSYVATYESLFYVVAEDRQT